jgi:hypothetical protein
MSDSPFFLWSIAEAWQWLVHVPVLGFVLLLVMLLVMLLFVVWV